MKKLMTYVLFLAVIAVGCLNSSTSLNAETTSSQRATNEIVYITRANLQEILDSPRPVIIDVYTDWCGPCKTLAPIFKELNDQYGNRYLFAKLNGEDLSLVRQFQIKGYPTIIFLKNGVEAGRHLGFLNKDKFIQKMHQYFEE